MVVRGGRGRWDEGEERESGEASRVLARAGLRAFVFLASPDRRLRGEVWLAASSNWRGSNHTTPHLSESRASRW